MDAAVASRVETVDEAGAEVDSRQSRREQQVVRILDAAKCCFVRSGFQGASMQHICAEAGMSPGALYRYFPSKESIIEAIAAADRRADAEIMAPIATTPAVLDGIVACGMAHLRHVHETGKAPLFIEIRAEAMRNEAVRRALVLCMQDASDAFRERLRAAFEQGEIDPAVDVDTVLAIIMAIGEGVTMSDLPARGIPYDKIETAMRAMLEGLLRPRRSISQPPVG